MRIDGSRLEFDVGGEFGKILERPVEEIGPDAVAPLAVGGGVQRLSVLFRVERRKRDPPPLERDPLRPPRGMRLDQGADGQRGLRRYRGGGFLEASDHKSFTSVLAKSSPLNRSRAPAALAHA